ncbi:MAG: ketoacyl-ACP synthase III [Ignavibacteriae bacterium]|nr:ketoacyl-ACP synthase III [Ignavibacteriota bacterium]MCB9244064.1 ketoacyl-ACP synthase III [Ignavibacteriales bacterium]
MNLTIEAIEYYLPGAPVTNAEMASENPEWDMAKVESKTGVYTRYIASQGETAFDLGIKACEKLFASNKVTPGDIGGIIFCTQSPDYIMPSNAFLVHEHFSMPSNVFAFDYNLACSGYVYGLAIAASMLNTGLSKNILLINGDTYSRFINPGDRSTKSLFGDAATVSLLGVGPSGELIDVILQSSGKDYKSFYVPAGGCRIPFSQQTAEEEKDESGNIRSLNDIYMNGFGVWKFIGETVPAQIKELLKRNDLSKDDIDCFIFHQASKLTLDSLLNALKLDKEKVYMNMDKVGNTVSASIPIALKDAWDEGKIKRGDRILLSGFGVGLSWASAIIKF